MWPFHQVKRDSTTWDEWRSEFDRRLKALEREHDDLHASYRKLRAWNARAPLPPADPAPPGNGGGATSVKDQLRRQYLGRGRGVQPPPDA
jgi:hypothetical protein